jgi:hypothetical protein
MTITKDTAPPTTCTTRLSRGLGLAETHFEEITRLAPWFWSVPSCTGAGVYVVDLKSGSCSCPDRVPEGERCKHEHAALCVKARTATCEGCGERFRHSELYDVPEESPTLLEGALVCPECALIHDVL